MAKIPNLKIVAKSNSARDVDVYDADTGEKLLNVYGVRIDINPGMDPVVKATIVAGVTFEYDGPAELRPEFMDPA